MDGFFRGFSFDTLIALISCIVGVVGLFLGGKAYHKCKKEFVQKKKFSDNGIDNSQNAGRDIIVKTCDANALATLTSANFSIALNEAYKRFEQQTENNLKKVIEETSKIVQEKKLEISGYTKIDWINIYFESAKNAADTYMQNVWAKVLARELEQPGTFGYKTLDVLKNMSKEDFILFEKMCAVQIDYAIFRGEAYKKQGIEWLNLIKMSELGLLSLDGTTRTYKFDSKGKICLLYDNEYVIYMTNNTEEKERLQLEVFILTYAAKELLSIVSYKYTEQFLEDIVEDLKKINNTTITYNIQEVVTIE